MRGFVGRWLGGSRRFVGGGGSGWLGGVGGRWGWESREGSGSGVEAGEEDEKVGVGTWLGRGEEGVNIDGNDELYPGVFERGIGIGGVSLEWGFSLAIKM